MPHQGKIFIVEDDPTIIKLLKDHLSANYQVETSQNFRDVRKEVEDFNPDLVLMDITLPYFNGFYWTTQIRKSKNMPIVFISSSDDEMDMVMALNMGGDDFIAKPFSLPLLDANTHPKSKIADVHFLRTMLFKVLQCKPLITSWS